MASTSASPTRVHKDVHAAAKVAAELTGRTVAEQLAHWTRIGSEVESVVLLDLKARRRTANELLAGRDYDSLTADEQALARTGLDVIKVTETVFPHPSKVDLVRHASRLSYRVHLRVLMVPVEQSVARVELRVRKGGHGMPEAKIRERHARLWAHVVDAIRLAYESRVYDASGQRGRPFLVVARYSPGGLHREPDWPTWTPKDLRGR